MARESGTCAHPGTDATGPSDHKSVGRTDHGDAAWLRHVENSTSGFIRTLGAGVCRAPYSGALFDAWETWRETHETENDCPAVFGEEQLYLLLFIEHGGRDMDGVPVRGLR